MRIGIGGSAANPPHLGHQKLIEGLLRGKVFDKVIWIPCGDRNDKSYRVTPDDRVIMTMLTFPVEFYLDCPLFQIRFSDVYGENTSTFHVIEEFEQRFPTDEVIWFTGADSVIPLKRLEGKCELETWDHGEELMQKRFCILPRPGFTDPRTLVLPPNFEVVDVGQLGIDSSHIRYLIAKGLPFEQLMTKEAAAYIKNRGLYGWRGK